MRVLFLVFTILITTTSFGQNSAKAGEWFRYRIHYGPLNAGYAELELFQEAENELHVVGTGKTTGMVGVFFKVKDRYESYFSTNTQEPKKFIRRVNEGGYIINRDVYFEDGYAITHDFKKNTVDSVAVEQVYDMLSAFYKLRETNFDGLENGETINLSLFFDREIYPFQMKLLDREIISTKFGKIKTLKFRPLVQSGRVFKEQESLTIWVTDDSNKIPVRIKADLAVGSLKADLNSYKGLSHPFNTFVSN